MAGHSPSYSVGAYRYAESRGMHAGAVRLDQFVEALNWRRVRYERSRGPRSSLTYIACAAHLVWRQQNVNNNSAGEFNISASDVEATTCDLVVVVAVSGKRLVALIWMWFQRQNEVLPLLQSLGRRHLHQQQQPPPLSSPPILTSRSQVTTLLTDLQVIADESYCLFWCSSPYVWQFLDIDSYGGNWCKGFWL